jgi:hypothetical protein
MMNPAWPKRIDSGHTEWTFANACKTGFQQNEIQDVFGQLRLSRKCCAAPSC